MSSPFEAHEDASGLRSVRRRAAALPPPPSRVNRLLREAAWIVGALVVIALTAFLATYARGDPGFTHAPAASGIANVGGRLGAWVADVRLLGFGGAEWVWVLAGRAWVVRSLRRLRAP